MFSKINTFKIKPSRKMIALWAVVFACSFVGIQLIIANRFSEPENVLYKNLIEELVKQDVCKDRSSCANQISLYRRSGSRVYFNLYNQTDRTTAAIVGKFLVQNGIKLSNNMPITFKAYSTPKKGYLDLDYYFGREKELLKLDIEKK